MDWLESAISALSPALALRREQDRRRLDLYRLATDSTLRTIVRDKGGANTVTRNNNPKLRDWGRHLTRNNPTAQSLVREVALRTSHFQVVPMARNRAGELAEDFNEQLAQAWLDFRDALDMSGVMSYRQLRQLMTHSYVRDGEVYAQILLGARRINYATDIPLTLQPLESDYLPLSLNTDKPLVVQGVEVTSGGAVRAYHIYKKHPGEFSIGFTPTTETIRIPADRMLSLIHAERLGQLRGISMLAPSGETLADVDEYLEGERISMKFASTVGLQIVRAPDMQTPVLNSDGQRTIDFEPGMLLDQLQPGEKAEILSHDRPGSQFEGYLRQMNRQMAAGVGANYSAVTNDFDGSYSSQRQMLVTAAAWYEHQQALQIARIDQPLHKLFLQALTLAGQMPVTRGVDPDTISEADFIPPGMPWIDPQKEATAQETAVKNGFQSRQGVIRSRGDSVKRIDKEIESDDFTAPSVSSGVDPMQPRSADQGDGEQRQDNIARLPLTP